MRDLIERVDVDEDCTGCDGEGFEDCPHPLECWNPGCAATAGVHPCGCCGGSGRAVDQVLWFG